MASSFDPDRLYPRTTELDDGRQLHIYQSEVGDVGCVVWDAAIVLAKFYEHVLSGQRGLDEPSAGDGQRGDAQRGDGQRGDGQRGDGQRGDGQRGDGQRGDGQRGDGQRGDGQRGDGQRGDGQRGDGQRGDGQRGDGQRGDGQRGGGQRGGGQRGDGQRGDLQALEKLTDIMRQNSGEMVELGAGTGYAGIVAASLGAQVKVTDLPEFVELMDYNVKENLSLIEERGGQCNGHPLVWGEEVGSKAKLVILADCIYYEKSLSPLVKTLVDLCGPDSLVICCHEERTTDNKPQLQRKFFAEVREHFSVVKIPTAMQHPTYSSDDIHIHILEPLTAAS